jgi:hypothetical protein
MSSKIVGEFLIYFLYNTSINQKRKQALLRSNLPAIRFTDILYQGRAKLFLFSFRYRNPKMAPKTQFPVWG